MIFWRPGNLNLTRRSTSWALLPFESLQWTDKRTWPMATLAHVPSGFPNAPLIPVWSISSSTWKHLVDTQDMERVHSHPKMESILASILCHVLVACNASSLKRLTWHILLLPTYKVNTEWKFINSLFLHTHIINPDLGIRHTTAVMWFWVKVCS